jgi:CelD/BcsL family acetyltransferase involved in cellulose biosynthesis
MLAPAHAMLTTQRRSLAALADIVAPWRALAENALEPNIFYHPDFARAAAPLLGSGVEAVLVWDSSRLVGFFPLTAVQRRYGARLGLARGWTHPFGPLGTPLVHRELAIPVVAAFLDYLAEDETAPKHLLLPYLHEAGLVAATLKAALSDRGGMCVAIGRHRRAALMPGKKGADYLAEAIGPKRRKELRRQRHRLADRGAVKFTLTQSPGDVTAALREFCNLEAAGWKGRAGTAIAQQPAIVRFVETAVGALAAQNQANIARLTCGPRTLASAIVLRSGAGAWGWKVAYDEAFAEASPGVQLYLDLTETLLADPAIAVVDSCATADHPMIDHIWRERLPIADWLITLKPGHAFNLICRLEALRRRALALARSARARLRGGR